MRHALLFLAILSLAATACRPRAIQPTALAPTPTLNFAAPENMMVSKNIQYREVAGSDPDLTSLDVYAPENASGLPVMVWIHGGGWSVGDKANREGTALKSQFFVANGWVLVAINYRLSPAVQHPAHVEDVAYALAYIHQNAAGWGGDPQRMFIIGHSAGAHLAALVAIDESYLTAAGSSLDIIQGVVLLDGAGYDIPRQIEEAGPVLSETYRQAFTEDPAVQTEASPLTHVAAGKGIPPFLIIHVAERDASREQSLTLAAALNAAGGEATVYAAEDKTHLTINREFGAEGDAPTLQTMEALNRWLVR